MKESIKRNLTAWLFMAPYLVFFGFFMAQPILRGLGLSFFKAGLGTVGNFVGISNYKRVFGDVNFWHTLGNTLMFVVVSTQVITLVGFTMAMLVNAKLRGRTLFRLIYFAPYVLSMSVVTGLWRFIFQPYLGLFSIISGVELFWLSTRWLSWIAILVTTTWWTVGFNMILCLAGLQDIPEEIYEAARIDGASRKQILFRITIPMMSGVMVMVFMLQAIQSFKLFGQPYLLTLGGPGNHTKTIVHYIYQTGFLERNMGLSSAMSIMFLIVVLLFTLLQNRLLSKREG